MVSVEQLTVEFGGFTLFGDLSFVVNQSDKIALVGRNGAGKSTLLKIFAGIQQPTRGKVSFPKDVTIGYLPQHMLHQDNLHQSVQILLLHMPHQKPYYHHRKCL